MFSCTKLGIKRASQRLIRFSHADVKPTTIDTTGSSSAKVRYETEGSLAIITLCHPAARNTLDVDMIQSLDQMFTEFEKNPAVHVGVLVGTGGSFSAGSEMPTNAMDVDPKLWATSKRTHFRKPMVCGIDGFCVGSGLELALMCDLRVVEEDACLGFFNRRYGWPLTNGASQRLPAMVGLSRALDLIMTGRAIGGKEALDMGLANRLVATGTGNRAQSSYKCY